MIDHHYNLFEKSKDYYEPGKSGFLYFFPRDQVNNRTYQVFWNKDKTIRCFYLPYLCIYGIENEEQIWKVFDAHEAFYKHPDFMIEEFKAKMLRKNCKFYKETFGDIKLVIEDT